MVNTRSRYTPRSIQTARQVLLELTDIFRNDLDNLVFVGGMACALLFDQTTDPHEGTIDIDIALDPVALVNYDEDTLEDKLLAALYQQDVPKKYRWVRIVPIGNEPLEIKVDLLTGEYEDSQRHQQSRQVQGLSASIIRGMDLAFLNPTKALVEGTLPNRKPHQAEIQVCSAASFLAMKGIAIEERIQGADKDAMDIDYILRRFPGGPDALARVFQTEYYAHNGLVQEGLRGIAASFAALDAFGPTSIATADRYPNPDERAIMQQGAFQRVQRLLKDWKTDT